MAEAWNGGGRPLGQQKVDVFLSMRGVQDIEVVVHHANTESAVVSARIGGALLYFHDWAAAASIMRGLQRLSPKAAKLPPLHHATAELLRADAVRAVTVVDIHGSVRVAGELLQIEGHPNKLSMTMGRLRLLIHDRVAYASIRSAFQQAEELGASVLPRPETPNLRSVAMETVVKALEAPEQAVPGRGRRAESPRPAPLQRGGTPGRWFH